MKKYIILAAAALAAMAACSKVVDTPDTQREISFVVANRLQTKATGVVYENGAFGTYSWFTATSGSDHADFMVNETVDLVGGVWKTTENTFYWPKTGSIDFISYSPFAGTNGTAGTVPAITQNTITYTGVTAGTTDLMYADKVNCSANVNEVTDSDSADSGYSGVPTVFRHALAKVSFKIKANFLEYKDPTTQTTTRWEVKVRSAKISGFKTTGNCALTLNADGKSWDKPYVNIGDDTNPDYKYIWTDLTGATDAQELVPDADINDPDKWLTLTTDPQELNPASGFVIPQQLLANAQTLDLNLYIKTTLSNGNVIEEDYITSSVTPTPDGLFPSINIKDISSLEYWEMNQNIAYTINIKPVSYVSDWDTPNDVIIRFDPAVADWTKVDANATIHL